MRTTSIALLCLLITCSVRTHACDPPSRANAVTLIESKGHGVSRSTRQDGHDLLLTKMPDAATLNAISRLGGPVRLYLRKNTGADVVLERLLSKPSMGRNLETLNCQGTKLTDNGTRRLSQLANLRALNLAGTAIGDKTMFRLAKIKSLERLDVSETNVTNAGIECLTKTSIVTLKFERTMVGDDALAQLLKMPKLRVIYCGGTSLTQTVQLKLRESGLALFGTEQITIPAIDANMSLDGNSQQFQFEQKERIIAPLPQPAPRP